MMKKKGIIILSFLVLLIVAAALIFYYMTPKEVEPEYVFSYAENQTKGYPTTLAAQYFADLVEEKTEGRIRIIVHAEGELGTEKEVLQQMQYGGIDFARVSLSQLAELVPEMNVLQMPYLYENSDHMWRVLDGDIGNTFLEYVNSREMVGLSWYDAGARNFYNSVRPITCLEDMEGLRIRVQESEVMADMVESLGAIAQPITYSEVYSSLERGFCDGAENNWPSYEAMLHYEVAGYYTVDEHTRVPELQLCSQHTWDVLSEQERKIIAECAKESAVYERELWVKYEEEARMSAIKNGTKVVELSEEEKERFQQAVQPIYKKYCGEYMDILYRIMELVE